MNCATRLVSTASYLSAASDWLFEETATAAAKWTPEENKRFENALALFDKDTPDRWHNVASMLPGKTVGDVVRQYRDLVEDVGDIEAGLIPIPGYSGNSFAVEWMSGHGFEGWKNFYRPGSGKRGFSAARCSDHERKKGVPWTEKEHRQFLLGLKKYGKGDWRNISRSFVTTRTPTQVASHAQKYFIRQLSGGKDKRRSSIHDITTVNLDEIKSSSPQKNGPGPGSPPPTPNRILHSQHNVNSNGPVVRPVYDTGLKSPRAILGNFNDRTIHFQGTPGYSGETIWMVGETPKKYLYLCQ